MSYPALNRNKLVLKILINVLYWLDKWSGKAFVYMFFSLIAVSLVSFNCNLRAIDILFELFESFFE